MREKIKISYEGKEYEFYAVPNMLEERQIKQNVVKLLGGYEEYASLQSAISDSYSKHVELNVKKYGEEEFKKKLKRLNELEDAEAESEEYKKLFDELNDNKYYKNFSSLVFEEMLLNDYAFLQVMYAGEENFEIFDKSEKFLRGLVAEVNKERGFFRNKDKTVKAVSES